MDNELHPILFFNEKGAGVRRGFRFGHVDLRRRKKLRRGDATDHLLIAFCTAILYTIKALSKLAEKKKNHQQFRSNTNANAN